MKILGKWGVGVVKRDWDWGRFLIKLGRGLSSVFLIVIDLSFKIPILCHCTCIVKVMKIII